MEGIFKTSLAARLGSIVCSYYPDRRKYNFGVCRDTFTIPDSDHFTISRIVGGFDNDRFWVYVYLPPFESHPRSSDRLTGLHMPLKYFGRRGLEWQCSQKILDATQRLVLGLWFTIDRHFKH
jgi:hypothetical protein